MRAENDTGKGVWRDRLWIAVFSCAIAAPAALASLSHVWPGGWIPEPVAAIREKELRVAEPWPEWTGMRSLQRFPEGFDAWFADRFALRPLMIRLHSTIYIRGLSLSPNDRFLLGKNGWVFRAGSGYLESYRTTRAMEKGRLRAWRKNLMYKRRFLGKRGIRYAFLFAPQKSTIYPEELPDWLTRIGSVSRLDMFLDHMRENSRVHVFDVRPAILEAKRREEVYYPLGSHWNDLGAFAAYEAIAEKLQKWYPEISPTSRDDMQLTLLEDPGDDFSGGLYFEGRKQDNPMLRRVGQPRPPIQYKDAGGGTVYQVYEFGPPDAPRAVLLKDSFSNWLGPFLAPHFSRLVLIFDSLDGNQLDPERERERVLAEEPDIVLEELAEWALVTRWPDPEPWAE